MRRAPLAQPAAVALALFILLHFVNAGSMGPGVPENITVTFLNPTTVRVSWSTSADLVEKYDVTYKPSDARVVLEVAGNSDAVILSGLEADTQYQVTVAALWGGHKYRSRPIVFRTLEPPRTSPQEGGPATPRSAVSPPDPSPTFPTIRGVEIGIVVLVLIVWIGAIALFFNRWGKIRMLLPYQPDYKQEQLKVPGSSALAAAAAGGTCGGHSAPSACSLKLLRSPPLFVSLNRFGAGRMLSSGSLLPIPETERPRLRLSVCLATRGARRTKSKQLAESSPRSIAGLPPLPMPLCRLRPPSKQWQQWHAY
ncbi:Fibronectin type III domain-containing protein 5 [Papilio machaon]|uniref:Fibronectin type III domain-containing protein 5 n=1 Tax=Papilio machaon TaxID=76193 RepID=A0A0N1PJI4_PAPMA|nr:Fibronectin type III domain-containing protein 5 [Papilio machaon]